MRQSRQVSPLIAPLGTPASDVERRTRSAGQPSSHGITARPVASVADEAGAKRPLTARASPVSRAHIAGRGPRNPADHEPDVGDRPLLNSFRKLKFARDAHDPFGEGGGGLFATHPHIEERLDRAGATTTASFLEENEFQGLTDNGELVATLRFDVQRLFQDELDVIATLSTTPELSEEDDVNTINVRVRRRPPRIE